MPSTAAPMSDRKNLRNLSRVPGVEMRSTSVTGRSSGHVSPFFGSGRHEQAKTERSRGQPAYGQQSPAASRRPVRRGERRPSSEGADFLPEGVCVYVYLLPRCKRRCSTASKTLATPTCLSHLIAPPSDQAPDSAIASPHCPRCLHSNILVWYYMVALWTYI